MRISLTRQGRAGGDRAALAETMEARRLLATIVSSVLPNLGGTFVDGNDLKIADNARGDHALAVEIGGDIVVQLFDADARQILAPTNIAQQTSGTQATPDVALWADGSFVVAWADRNGRDGADYGIYARTFDAGGAPTSNDLLVNVTTTGRQDRPHVAADPDGSFVVTWESDHAGRGFRNYDVMARRFIGGVGGAELTVAGTQSWEPTIAINDEGVAMVAYMRSGGYRIDAVTIVGETVSTTTEIMDFGLSPSLAVLSDGGFACVAATGSQVRGRMVDADLTPKGSTQTLESYVLDPDYAQTFDDAVVAADGAGGIAIVWTYERLNLNDMEFENQVRYRTFDETLTPTAARTDVPVDYASDPIGVAALGDGTFSFFADAARTTMQIHLDLGTIGTGGNDVFTLTDVAGGGVEVTTNGVAQTFAYAGNRVVMDLGAGDNSFNAMTSLANLELTVGEGNDTIITGGGYDKITDAGGHNSISAGAGNDHVVTGGGKDTIHLGEGDDYVYAGGGRDIVYGGAGNDTLTGGAALDVLYGDDGDDRISGNGSSDRLFGGTGYDRLYGGDGDDLLDGGTQSDRLYGGDGNDLLAGGAARDRLHGEAGNDTLNGGSQTDTLLGGAGNDLLFSRDGTPDELFGGDDDDEAVADLIDQLLEIETVR